MFDEDPICGVQALSRPVTPNPDISGLGVRFDFSFG